MVSESADLADFGDDLEREKAEETENLDEHDGPSTGKTSAETATTGDEGNDAGDAGKVVVPVYRPRQALLNALRDWLPILLAQVGPSLLWGGSPEIIMNIATTKAVFESPPESFPAVGKLAAT